MWSHFMWERQGASLLALFAVLVSYPLVILIYVASFALYLAVLML